jgi:hypothetical protein
MLSISDMFLPWRVTVVGVVHLVSLWLAVRSFLAYYRLSAVFVVNTSLKWLKLNQNAYTSHILCIWSVWASASTCIYCCTLSTTPLRTFLHSNWYTHEAPAFSPFPTLCCISAFSKGEFSCRGEFFISTLICAWWVHLSTRGEILRFPGSSIKGEKFCLLGFLSSKGRDVLFGAVGLWERFLRVLWQGEENWAFCSFC